MVLRMVAVEIYNYKSLSCVPISENHCLVDKCSFALTACVAFYRFGMIISAASYTSQGSNVLI